MLLIFAIYLDSNNKVQLTKCTLMLHIKMRFSYDVTKENILQMHASKMRLPLDVSTLFELEFFHRTVHYVYDLMNSGKNIFFDDAIHN